MILGGYVMTFLYDDEWALHELRGGLWRVCWVFEGL